MPHRRSLLAVLALVVLWGLAPAARADLVMYWHYWGAGVTASGELTVAPLGPYGVPYGPYDYYVTGITGERNGQALSGLIATSSPGAVSYYATGDGYQFVYDNRIHWGEPAVPSLNDSGILYFSPLDAFGGHPAGSPNPGAVNIYYDSGQYQEAYHTGYQQFSVTPVQWSLTSPEPSTWVLFLGALALLATRLWCRSRSASWARRLAVVGRRT